ncbi:hypothetical protein [Klebsiella grimontii]|uniref:hypothetical protein n=1 Tax=Klebsiella grimontii TaxID=2058152 RepID=UPI0022433730|nr:hypothetical protein [Klebsiella grimontii]
MDEGDYYKVYGYTYDKKWNIHTNAILDKDLNFSGYNAKNNPFKYKKRDLCKKYILENHGS